MKRMILRRRFALFTLWLVAALALASCSQDGLTEQGTPLPVGQYPLELTVGGLEAVAVPASAPSTRATVDGTWESGMKVAVQVGAEVKLYDVTPSDDGTTATLSSSDPFYWTNTSDTKTITAWHPYSETYPETWTVKADQSSAADYQASDLIKGELKDLAFQDRNNVMIFQHQTAKVEINLTATEGVTLDDAEIKLLNLTGVEGGGNIITPYRPDNTEQTYLALLGGQTITANTNFIQVTANGTDYYYQPDADKELVAGTAYTYNITVKAEGLDVTVGESMNWTTEGAASGEGSVNLPDEIIDLSQVNGNIEIGNGTYLLIGNGQEINHPIIVNGNADITFQDEVKIKAETAMKIGENCQVKLTVKGKGHSLVSIAVGGVDTKIEGTGIQIGNNSGIEIVGDSRETSTLSVTDSPGCAGIGLPNRQSSSCTGIIIRDIDLIVNSTGQSHQGSTRSGAAIGLGYIATGNGSQELEKIEIIDSHITATSETGACIGMGLIDNETTYIGKIAISGSVLSLTTKKISFFQAACIGFGANIAYTEGMRTSIGSVNISNTDFDNCTGYQIIGNGMCILSAGNEILTLGKFTNGITIDGVTYKDWWNSETDNGGFFGTN